MSSVLAPVEKSLGDLFKKLPQLPANAKKALADFYPWLAIIGGVLWALLAWGLWQARDYYQTAANLVNSLSAAYGGGSVVPSIGIFYWISFAATLATAVMMFLAYPGLKAKKKVGWDWLFLAGIINLVAGVLLLFVNRHYGGGVGALIKNLISSTITFWLLYQVREYFKGTAK